MKDIKINWYNNQKIETVYKSDAVRFSILKKVGDKSFDQIQCWRACRETFLADINSLEKATGKTRIYLAVYKNFNSRDKSHEWKRFIKKVLNVLERRMGWGLTSIHSVCTQCTENLSSSDSLFIVSGSRKWAHCQQLLSLYLLLIRCSNNKPFQNSFLKNFDLVNAGKYKPRGGYSSDQRAINQVLPFLPAILDNVDKLFFHQSSHEAFRSQSFMCGISNYIKNSGVYGGNPTNIKRFKEYVRGEF